MVLDASSISVIDRVIEGDSIPSSLFAGAEAIMTATNDREVVVAAAHAVFSLVGKAAVTFTVYSDAEGGYVVYDNYRDGKAWEWKVGNVVAESSLTNLMARAKRPVERHVPKGANDEWFLDYPDFYGIPLLFEDGMLVRAMTVGVEPRPDVTNERLIYYLRMIGGFCEKSLQRIAQVRCAVDAGQTLEREYILQELHDTAIQDIFACELGLMNIIDELPADADEPRDGVFEGRQVKALRGRLSACLKYAQEANLNMRKILNEKSARRRDSLMLVSTLVNAEIASHANASDVPVVPMVSGDVEIGGNLARTVRMFVHECLCNVRKHAGAAHVVVYSGVRRDILSLCVEDDGRGFDPASIRKGQADGGVPHFGLANLEEAVRLVGGYVEVESAPGEGCAVRARIRLGDI